MKTARSSSRARGVARASAAPAAAQQLTTGGPRRGYTPAPGAKDLKAVLFNWFWYMGMLRGPHEIEAVATLEHKATGTFRSTASRAS